MPFIFLVQVHSKGVNLELVERVLLDLGKNCHGNLGVFFLFDLPPIYSENWFYRTLFDGKLKSPFTSSVIISLDNF